MNYYVIDGAGLLYVAEHEHDLLDRESAYTECLLLQYGFRATIIAIAMRGIENG